MPLKTFVKASGINNLSDARYFAVYPVDWLSYNCKPEADNYVTTESIKELQGWVEGPKMALEVEGMLQEEIDDLVEQLNPQGLQVGIEDKVATHLEVFRVMEVKPTTTKEEIVTLLNNEELQTNYLLLNFADVSFESIENQTKLILSDLKEINDLCPLLVTNVSNVEEVNTFMESELFGLGIAGGNEEKVGIRSFDDIQDIMDELEVWD